MTLGPIFRRELRAAAVRRDLYIFRCLIATLLGGWILGGMLVALSGSSLERTVFPAEELRTFGIATFIGMLVTELVFLGFHVPALVGVAIAEERERNTLPFLFLSRLTRVEIVLIKLAGRLLPAISLATAGIPVAAASAYMGGLFPEAAVLALVMVLSTTMVMGAISIMCSARAAKSSTGVAGALGLVWTWLVLTPIVTVLPTPSYAVAAELMTGLKFIAGWVAPSSPLWLVFNRSWYVPGGTGSLPVRVAVMVATQGVIGVLAVTAAVISLRRYEPRTATADLYLGFRPPCGDDPIFWREFDLPNRTGSRFKPFLMIRQVALLVRVMLVVMLQLIGLTIALAIPIAIVWAAVRLGVPAFRENRYGAHGFDARTDLNGTIRGVSALFMIVLAAGGTTSAAGRITVERIKSTWTPLLSTPLEGAEILGGKMRVNARFALSVLWLLAPIWLLGVACGAVHPLGAALAALDFMMAVWLGIALGTWLGIRPGEVSTANSLAAVASMAMVTIHGTYMLAVLFFEPDFEKMRLFSPLVRAAVWATLIGLPAVSWAIVWRLKRRMLARFDEWVDRPRRSPMRN